MPQPRARRKPGHQPPTRADERQAGRRTPRSGVPVILRDAAGREVARAVSDFDGYVLFDALAYGTFAAEAGGQTVPRLTISRAAPDAQGRLLLPAKGA